MKKFLLFAFVISMIGCSKDASIVKTSGSSLSPATAAPHSTYLPLTANTYWKYSKVIDTTTRKFISTVTAKTDSINGKLYTLTTIGKNDSAYYCQQGINYYQYHTSETEEGNIPLEILFLKDTTKGATWETTAGYVDGVLPVICDGQVIKKNISLVIHGNTYTNIIHTRVTLTVQGPDAEIGTFDYFTAENVGLVKIVESNEFGSTSTSTTALISYHIE